MPTYDYKCPKCSRIESHQHKMNENVSVICLDCFHKGSNSQMKKQFSVGLGLHFKGNGFYETDYKSK